MKTLLTALLSLLVGHVFAQANLPAFSCSKENDPEKNNIWYYMQSSLNKNINKYFYTSGGEGFVVASFTMDKSGNVRVDGFDRKTDTANRFLADALKSTTGMWSMPKNNSKDVHIKLPILMVLGDTEAYPHVALTYNDTFRENPSKNGNERHHASGYDYQQWQNDTLILWPIRIVAPSHYGYHAKKSIERKVDTQPEPVIKQE